jgi:hypothetical protein
MFSEQEVKAFNLGSRMASTDFSMTDNPFASVQPRLARKWMEGFLSASALRNRFSQQMSGARALADTFLRSAG